MRATYIYIILFFAWGALSAWWYVLSVKGLTVEPAAFDPHENTIAIIEILIMMLVALLIGFGISWQLRGGVISQKVNHIEQLENQVEELRRIHLNLTSQFQSAEKEWKIRQRAYDQQLNYAKEEKEKLLKELEKATASNEDQLLDDQKRNQKKIEELESSLSLHRYRDNQHEAEVGELKASIQRLEDELQQESKQSVREPVFSDFISGQRLGVPYNKKPEKDDLKKIKGIGPVIEQRLNEIGVMTYVQLTELDEWVIKKIGDAIKYFPDRILRDDWVGQARALLND